MFVIPCRFDPERPIIFDCVNRIRAHHPDSRIVVVDSDSPDTSYLHDLDCETIDAQNRHYGPGAFKLAVDANPDVEFFYLFFDSLLVNDNLDDLRGFDLTTVRWIPHPPTGWGWNDDTGEPLDGWAKARKVRIPEQFDGVLGPMIAARRWVIEEADLFRILPTNRFEQCALERCWGIWLAEAGVDVRRSLQGEMRGFHDAYDETRVAKVTLARN